MIGRGEKTDSGAQLRHTPGEMHAVQADRPSGRRDQTGQKLQQRRLAGSVRSQQRHALAGRKIEAQISECPEKTVRLGEFVNGYAQPSSPIAWSTPNVSRRKELTDYSGRMQLIQVDAALCRFAAPI